MALGSKRGLKVDPEHRWMGQPKLHDRSNLVLVYVALNRRHRDDADICRGKA